MEDVLRNSCFENSLENICCVVRMKAYCLQLNLSTTPSVFHKIFQRFKNSYLQSQTLGVAFEHKKG